MNFGYKTLLTLTVSAFVFESLAASEQTPAAQPELQKTAEIAVVAPNVEAPKVEQNAANQIKATMPAGEHVVIPDTKNLSQTEILKIIKNAIVGLTGMHAEVLSALASETVDALSKLEKAGIVVVQGNGFSILTTKLSLEKFSIPAIKSLESHLIVPVSELNQQK